MVKKKVHLVYPCKDVAKAPEIIGFKVKKLLEGLGYDVIVHQWDARHTIHPNLGDILIGHAHPLRNTVFRNSVKTHGWSRRILFQPFNFSLEQNGYLDEFIDSVDTFIAICGEFWSINLERSPFSHFKPIFRPINLAIDAPKYQCSNFASLSRDKFGKRKALYVGNDHPGKNVSYLNFLATHVDMEIHWVGGNNKRYKNLISHGKMQIPSEEYFNLIRDIDFHIVASVYDANPTTVLETASSGLIQITTDTSGYLDPDLRFKLTLNSEIDLRLLAKLSAMEARDVEILKANVYDCVNSKYTWEEFSRRFISIFESNPSEVRVFPVGIRVNHVHPFFKLVIKRWLKPLKKIMERLIV